MNKITTLLLLALSMGCNADGPDDITPRNLGIRPAVTVVWPQAYLADVLEACAQGPAATDGPMLALHYEEHAKPGDEFLPWTLTIQAPGTSTPAKHGECIRAKLIEGGGFEVIPPEDTTGGSSTGG